MTCTQCHKATNHTTTAYKRRGVWLIRPEEKLCQPCARKRGARTLQDIHNNKQED